MLSLPPVYFVEHVRGVPAGTPHLEGEEEEEEDGGRRRRRS